MPIKLLHRCATCVSACDEEADCLCGALGLTFCVLTEQPSHIDCSWDCTMITKLQIGWGAQSNMLGKRAERFGGVKRFKFTITTAAGDVERFANGPIVETDCDHGVSWTREELFGDATCADCNFNLESLVMKLEVEGNDNTVMATCKLCVLGADIIDPGGPIP